MQHQGLEKVADSVPFAANVRAAVFIPSSQHHVLMAKSYSSSRGTLFWSLPGGKLRGEENPYFGCLREADEEAPNASPYLLRESCFGPVRYATLAEGRNVERSLIVFAGLGNAHRHLTLNPEEKKIVSVGWQPYREATHQLHMAGFFTQLDGLRWAHDEMVRGGYLESASVVPFPSSHVKNWQHAGFTNGKW